MYTPVESSQVTLLNVAFESYCSVADATDLYVITPDFVPTSVLLFLNVTSNIVAAPAICGVSVSVTVPSTGVMSMAVPFGRATRTFTPATQFVTVIEPLPNSSRVSATVT